MFSLNNNIIYWKLCRVTIFSYVWVFLFFFFIIIIFILLQAIPREVHNGTEEAQEILAQIRENVSRAAVERFN